MSIRGDVEELQSIRNEIKALSMRRKALKKREKEVISKITAFLKAKEQPGVKYQGLALLIEEKEYRPPKKKKDKEEDQIAVLEKLGVKHPNEVLKKLIEVGKQEPTIKKDLKMKKL